MKTTIAQLRKDYTLKTLDERQVKKNPMDQFAIFWDEVIQAKADEPNAMVLATVHNKQPRSRVVLLKSFDKDGFVFFTNYQSNKGKEITANPKVSLLFFWRELQRQVIIEGRIKKVVAKISDDYFHSRPLKSQLGAWASPQSQPLSNRKKLEKNFAQVEKKFAKSATIPRPAHWGGYVLVPQYVEFWQGRESRLHDRIVYTKKKGKDTWKIIRLAP